MIFRNIRSVVPTTLAIIVLLSVVATSAAATTDVTGEIILEEGREMVVNTEEDADMTFTVNLLEGEISLDLPNGNKIIRKIVGKM